MRHIFFLILTNISFLQSMVKVLQPEHCPISIFDIDLLHNDFWQTIESRDTEEVKKMLNNRKEIFDINNKRDGKTALIYAAGNGLTEIAQGLLQVGARPEETDKTGWTAFMWAVWMDNTAIVLILKQFDADIQHQDHLGKSILMWMAERGEEDAVEWLVGVGADPDLKNEQNHHQTALDYAPLAKRENIARAIELGQEYRQKHSDYFYL